MTPPAAGAPAGSVSVEVGAGHDDNMFLATAEVAAEPLLRLGGWFAGVSPELTGSLALSGLRLQASYLGDLRQADAVGRLGYHEGELLLGLPELGPIRLHLSGAAGRFDASRFPDDHYRFAGGEAGLRLALGSTFQVRAGLDAGLTAGPLSMTAGAWLGTLRLDATSETHAGGRIEARVALGRHLQLFASFDATIPTSAGATRDYARQVAILGTALAASGSLASPARRVELEQRPLVEGGRVRFRLQAAGVASVAVVGSWDDWATPGRVLLATRAPGLHEVWVDLPEGSHRYHFVVDGQVQKPPEAPRYAPDGFGGEDGVVDVPPRAGTNPPEGPR